MRRLFRAAYGYNEKPALAGGVRTLMKSIAILGTLVCSISCATQPLTQEERDILSAFKDLYGYPGAKVIVREASDDLKKDMPEVVIDGAKVFELTKLSVVEKTRCSYGEHAVLKRCEKDQCEYAFDEYICFIGHQY